MIELAIVASILVFWDECIHRNSLLKTAMWIKNNLINFIYSICIVLSVNFIFLFIFRNIWVSVFVTVLLGLIAGYSNKYKMKLRGDVYFPWDIVIVKEANNSLTYILNL